MAFFANIGPMPAGIQVGLTMDGRIVVADVDRRSAMPFAPAFGTPVYATQPIAIIGGQPYLAVKSVRICEDCGVSRARSGKRRCQECKDAERKKKAERKANTSNVTNTPTVSSSRKDPNCLLCAWSTCTYH